MFTIKKKKLMLRFITKNNPTIWILYQIESGTCIYNPLGLRTSPRLGKLIEFKKRIFFLQKQHLDPKAKIAEAK
jgi:hypothetical protein